MSWQASRFYIFRIDLLVFLSSWTLTKLTKANFCLWQPPDQSARLQQISSELDFTFLSELDFTFFIKVGFHLLSEIRCLSKFNLCNGFKAVTSAKLERYAVELQRIGLERNAPWSQMGFGTCFMHLSRSNLSGRPHLHQPFLCSRLSGNNLFERFHLHPCTSHTFSREAPIHLHFSFLCFLDNYSAGHKILNRLWFANSGWIFHNNISTKLVTPENSYSNGWLISNI